MWEIVFSPCSENISLTCVTRLRGCLWSLADCCLAVGELDHDGTYGPDFFFNSDRTGYRLWFFSLDEFYGRRFIRSDAA